MRVLRRRPKPDNTARGNDEQRKRNLKERNEHFKTLLFLRISFDVCVRECKLGTYFSMISLYSKRQMQLHSRILLLCISIP